MFMTAKNESESRLKKMRYQARFKNVLVAKNIFTHV